MSRPDHEVNAAKAAQLVGSNSQLGALRANTLATLAVYQLLEERLPEREEAGLS